MPTRVRVDVLAKHRVLDTFTDFLEQLGAHVQADILRLVISVDPRLVATFWSVTLIYLFTTALEVAAECFHNFVTVYPAITKCLTFSNLKKAGIGFLLRGWAGRLVAYSGSGEVGNKWLKEVTDSRDQIAGLALGQAIFSQAAEIALLINADDTLASMMAQVTAEPLRSGLQTDLLARYWIQGQRDGASAVQCDLVAKVLQIADPLAQATAVDRMVTLFLRAGEEETARQIVG